MPSLGYGFKFSDIVIPENTPTILLKMTHNDDTVEYPLDYDDGGWAHYSRSGDIYFYSPNSDTNYTLQIQDFTEADVGDEYTINLLLPEEPTQAFTSATHEAQKSGYVIEPDVYYDGEVTLTDDDDPITLSLQGNPDVEHFSEWNVTINGNAMTYYSETNMFIYADVESQDRVFFGYMNGAYLLATNRGTFIGVFPFKVQYDSASVEQSFADAVQMVVGGTVIFEADLENEVPVEVTGYENNSALMYDIYINGALCKRLQYSVLSGTPNYSTYDTTGELYVELTASTGEITLYANEGDTCHVKIVKKSRPESIMIFANKSGDAINVDASFGDILTAAKEGYTFQLAINGQISGPSTYSAIGTLAASLDTSNYTANFDSTVSWRGEAITWTVNLTNMSISGTVGGIT